MKSALFIWRFTYPTTGVDFRRAALSEDHATELVKDMPHD